MRIYVVSAKTALLCVIGALAGIAALLWLAF